MFFKFIFVLFILSFISCSSNTDENENIEPIKVNANAINGTWGGSLSTSLAPTWNVKMQLTYVDSDSTITGKVYFSSTATSEAKVTAINHGTIKMKVDGKYFRNVELIDLGRTGCPGEFRGTGEFGDQNRITLSTPGTDCAGDHTFFNTTLNKLD